jgi:hypothetical protein
MKLPLLRSLLSVLAAVLALAFPVGAQVEEPLVRWPYYKEIALPAANENGGLFDFVLDVPSLGKSRTDHADLRLYNASGKEVPYALRILRETSTTELLKAREFNRGVRGGAAEASYDLGEQPGEHNRLEIDTAGENFRRKATVEGSHDAKQWAAVVGEAFIFRFAAAQGRADERSVPYPVSRYRYLRVRVAPDPQADQQSPVIRGVAIHRTLRVPGETLAFPATVEGRAATRQNGRAASAYRISIGARVPLHGLRLAIADKEFSRPYQLEALGDEPPYSWQPASGQLMRRESWNRQEETIAFQEVFAGQMRLTVTDDRNAPLTLRGATALSAARQIIFQAATAGAGPLKLYYGNPKASAPHYDFAGALPRELPQAPARLSLGPEQANPTDEPEPAPVTERAPWLIYLVLGLASLMLFALLWKLTRSLTATREP